MRSLAAMVRECGSKRDLDEARRLHDIVSRSEHSRSTYLCNLLVQMYGKCSCIEDARRVFDGIVTPNVFSFTVLMAAYVQNAYAEEALLLFQEMLLEGLRPDVVAFITAFNACSSSSSKDALQRARKIHSCCSEFHSPNLEEQLYLHNSLITMYGKFSRLEEASQIFDSMERRDLVSWNSIISAFAQNGHFKEALELFDELVKSNELKPDRITFMSALDACAEAGDAARGREIHSKMGKIGSLDMKLSTTLMNMYGRAGELEDAQAVFDSMPQRDVFAWNTLINLYLQHDVFKQVLKLFKLMDISGVPANNFTLLSVFEACSTLEGEGAFQEARDVHLATIDSGLRLELVTKNAMLNMYWKCGGLEDAEKVFLDCSTKSVVTWTTMVSAYVHHGYPEKAVFLFMRMQQDGVGVDDLAYASILEAYAILKALEYGKSLHHRIVAVGLDSNVLVANGLINMYGKCGSVEEARGIFDGISRNVISWNTMLAAYSHNGRYREAIQLYNEMVGVSHPDRVTVITVLHACAESGDGHTGKQVHARMTRDVRTDPSVQIALVHMYGKCGNLEEAKRNFDQMPLEQRDVFAWTCLVTTFARNGRVQDSMKLVRTMDLEGIPPNNVTFVAVLYSCCHAGNLEDGKNYFGSMTCDYGIVPSSCHYGCMIDLLGRSGRLLEAQELSSYVPCDDLDWTSLLASCTRHLNVPVLQ